MYSLGAATITILLLIGGYQLWRRTWLPLPPGPKGLPLIGNVLQLRDKRWLLSPGCLERYGDMIYMTALGQSMVFLNTQKIAADLLDRRSSIYMERPHFIVATEFINRGMSMSLASPSDLWRRMRRASSDSFSKNAVRNYHTIQSKEAVLLAWNILSKPADVDKQFRRTAASMIMSVVYDLPPVKSDNDPNVSRVKEHVERLVASTTPGAHWVEFFPWMKYIPKRFAKWKRDAERYHRETNAMYLDLFSKVQNDLMNGIDRPSMSANLIKQQEHFGLSDVERAWTAGEMFTAASETTAGALSWWCLAMLAYPQTQARAQAELDTVVGRGRLPSFADRPHLPYTHAMVKEVLRWRPSLPFGIPHVATADDWYEGTFIPKGTMCFPNIWQCNHQAEVYGSDADEFDPARFLDEHGQLVPGPSDAKEDGHRTYGYGRRSCIGKYLANDSLFIDIATMLWAMRFERQKDASGNEVPVDVDTLVGDGLIPCPAPYSCRTLARFPEAAAMLAAARELQG
ncbi:cytochrome P450 [Lactifluus subvellereus]|nr:cytochrome P450 [Lactifluus subvellereus]KAI0253644.1 cytochrome P450 [Lactifluus subvellereus]